MDKKNELLDYYNNRAFYIDKKRMLLYNYNNLIYVMTFLYT